MKQILPFLLLLAIAGCSENPKNSIQTGEGNHGGEKKSQKVNCVNNLKMIGIAFKMWALDHNGNFPKNDTRQDKDGFDANAYLYLKTMNGEDQLKTPLLLLCPNDTTKTLAASFEVLTTNNVSYRFRALLDGSKREVLAVCPIDGNTLFSDGTVEQAK